MLRPNIVFLLLVTFGLASTGCQSTPISPPRETKVVTLASASREAAVSIALGTTLQLELPPPRASAHAWQIVQNDTRFLQPITALLASPAENGGGSTVTFQAVRSGLTRLKFLAAPAARPAENAAAEYYDVLITIE